MIKPKVVLLIFVSGKIVLTGAKVSPVRVVRRTRPIRRRLASRRVITYSVDVDADADLPVPPAWVREEIYTAFNTIYTVLCEFCKP
ncbi:TATA-box-binding protein [Mycena olivaceomarginata]|nr:TATA-box-binding protein [Mycena olivaceomarginata]